MKLTIDIPKNGYESISNIELASWNDLININKNHLIEIENKSLNLIKEKISKYSKYIPIIPVSMG